MIIHFYIWLRFRSTWNSWGKRWKGRSWRSWTKRWAWCWNTRSTWTRWWTWRTWATRFWRQQWT